MPLTLLHSIDLEKGFYNLNSETIHGPQTTYHLITLLSSLPKLLERTILDAHQPILLDKSRSEQFSFHQGRSTRLKLINLIDLISINLNNNKHIATIFFHMEKAFDRVWHEDLLHTIICIDIPLLLVKMNESFLSKRTFMAKSTNASSSHSIQEDVL